MVPKEIYNNFCLEHDVPVFFQPFWLDITCKPGRWDIVFAKKGKEIIGVMPFYKKRKGFIGMPPLTPYMGPFIDFPNDMKYTHRLSKEHTILKEIIDQLPNFKYFNQRFHPGFTNWLPFYWNEYQQTTRYTYLLPDINDLSNVYGNFKNNVKRNIKKAEKSFHVRELKEDEIEKFYRIIKKNRKPNFNFDVLQNLVKACEKRNCGKTIAAFDDNNVLYASIFLVWDTKKAYYILGARNPELNTNQAMSLILWSGIQIVSQKVKAFDFEGSMIEPIERYFRTYGAMQKRYMQVYKVRNKFFKLALCLADSINIKF